MRIQNPVAVGAPIVPIFLQNVLSYMTLFCMYAHILCVQREGFLRLLTGQMGGTIQNLLKYENGFFA